MKFKVGDKVRYKHPDIGDNVEVGEVGTIRGISPIGNYAVDFETKDVTKHNCSGRCHNNCGWWCAERTLEPVVPTLVEIKEKKLTCCINVKNIAEAQFLDAFFECGSYKDYCMKKYIDRVENELVDDTLAFQLTDGVIRDCCSANFYKSCGGRYGEVYEFSDLFPVGSTMMCGDRMCQRTESGITNISYENSINKLKTCLSAFPNDGISVKNGGKNTMKFTFYVTEGYRIDKSNNTRIPTITTEVLINGKDYQYGGSATCDKTDYEEREGVLNAIANAVCGGNFDREFNKVMKNKAFANKKSCTCTYCGQVFDTVEEKREHEAWHVECKKARRERYLLRKRAKEIAFEEQAQKMAKEMIEK